jgi:diacylglycerol kinase (ATP)
MLIAVVFNPGAGDRSIDADELVEALARAGHRVECWSTNASDWERALAGDHELVVAAGGDGTVHRVFTGLAGSSRVATIVPLGTANNVARTLGLRLDHPLRVIDGWATGSMADFDVPEAEIAGESCRVVEGVAGGVFASFVTRGHEELPETPTTEELWTLFADALADTAAGSWRIEVDGAPSTVELIGVHVMNVRHTGPVVPIAPDADPYDGMLDVVTIRPSDVAAVDEYVQARRRGRPVSFPPLECCRARHVRLIPPPTHSITVDDRPIGGDDVGPITVDAGSATVAVLVPGDRS